FADVLWRLRRLLVLAAARARRDLNAGDRRQAAANFVSHAFVEVLYTGRPFVFEWKHGDPAHSCRRSVTIPQNACHGERDDDEGSDTQPDEPVAAPRAHAGGPELDRDGRPPVAGECA